MLSGLIICILIKTKWTNSEMHQKNSFYLEALFSLEVLETGNQVRLEIWSHHPVRAVDNL